MHLFPYIPDHSQIPLMNIRETPNLHHNSAAQEGHFSALDLRRAGREIREWCMGRVAWRYNPHKLG